MIINHLKKYRMMVEVKLGWGRRAEFPPVKSRRFSWPYPTYLQWILILPLLGVDWFCDPHANLHCQPFLITVPCKNSDLEDMRSASNQWVKAGWHCPLLVPLSEIETSVWPAINISKYTTASICSKRQIWWDPCDLCFRFMSKTSQKLWMVPSVRSQFELYRF